MTRLRPPRGVRELADRLERAGHETWCVGGAVRDALLGHQLLDWDLATAATPDEVRRLFRRTIPLGIEFGTVGVFDRDGVMHEVTTFRRDIRTDGRHAVVEFGASLDEDLARRDFTINAIAYSPSRDALRDPFGGAKDLEAKIVRAVGDPAARLREDWLRALRGIRFASRFGFTFDGPTWDAIARSGPSLVRLSRERVKQELEKTMQQVDAPSRAFELWRQAGALASLVPVLASQPGRAFRAADAIPLPERTRRKERRSARQQHRITALFLGLPADEVRRATRDLRFSNNDVAWMTHLTEHWLTLEPGMTAALVSLEGASDAGLRRWGATVGRTRFAPLLRLAAAWWEAGRVEGVLVPSRARVASVYRRAIRIAYRDPIEIADLAIDGSDLIDAGFAPGPAVGKILRALLDLVIEDPSMNTRARLLAAARGLGGGGGASSPSES